MQPMWISIREVAAAAGVALAQVQHYFRTRAKVLRLACEHVCEKPAERVAKVDLGTGTTDQVLRRWLHSWLPPDDATRGRATPPAAPSLPSVTVASPLPTQRTSPADRSTEMGNR